MQLDCDRVLLGQLQTGLPQKKKIKVLEVRVNAIHLTRQHIGASFAFAVQNLLTNNKTQTKSRFVIEFPSLTLAGATTPGQSRPQAEVAGVLTSLHSLILDYPLPSESFLRCNK